MIQDNFAHKTALPALKTAPQPINLFWKGTGWERINLTITLEDSAETAGVQQQLDALALEQLEVVRADLAENPNLTAYYLVNVKSEHRIPLDYSAGLPREFSLNVVNFQNRKRIPGGAFKILPVLNGELHPFVSVSMADVGSLDSSGRIFHYNGNKSAYSVSFGITEDDYRPEILLRSYQFTQGGGRKKRSLRPKALLASVKRRISRLLDSKKMLNRFYRVARVLNPPTGSRLLFASEARTAMGGNLLSIYNKIQERGLDFDIRESFSIPSTRTRRSMLRTVYLIATSDVVVLDDYFSMLGWLKVSSDTTIIQAWHAGSGFKNVGYSRFGKYGSPKLDSPHRKYTYTIAGSTQLVETYSEAFGIEPSAVIPTGLPRVDDFLDDVKIAAFKNDFYAQYPQLKDKRIVLFAPTFRGRGINTAYYDYSQIDFDALAEYCGDDTVVLFRMHHFIPEAAPIPAKYADKFLDFTHFADGLSLLHVVDIMITDYSSIIYEYSMLDRPMLFFSYDREVYEATRGFHRDYKSSAPGKVCDSFDELMEALRTEDFEIEKVSEFQKANFDSIDRNSSDRFLDWILLKHLTPRSK